MPKVELLPGRAEAKAYLAAFIAYMDADREQVRAAKERCDRAAFDFAVAAVPKFLTPSERRMMSDAADRGAGCKA